MVNGFGPTGIEGPFRKSCEATLRVMREHKETLLTRGQHKVNVPSAESVQLILKRLEGHIVSPEVYKHKFSCAPMSLEGQVAKLIDIASDERNLVQMYIGWAPFI
ncbi:FATC domain protein [Dictyocaulus viviparus]|uniref:FATC domain protein n=1 Tax=Dictyocaulus viviparus TaxID=29172 RepID=A0A0D8XFX9_DICVI|nr:FATC domain protein [Dictyocaulus viviparus]